MVRSDFYFILKIRDVVGCFIVVGGYFDFNEIYVDEDREWIVLYFYCVDFD